jgi:hypothetical protein
MAQVVKTLSSNPSTTKTKKEKEKKEKSTTTLSASLFAIITLRKYVGLFLS